MTAAGGVAMNELQLLVPIEEGIEYLDDAEFFLLQVEEDSAG